MAVANLLVKIGSDISQFQDGMNKVSSTMQKTGAKMTSVGDAWTRSISLPLIAIGGSAAAAAIAVDEAYDSIRVGTGATGEALERLKESFDTVYGNVPASTEEVANAIGDLNTRLGLTGTTLEDLSTQMLNLARITESDVGSVIQSTTRVFGDWSIATEDQSSTLDYLFKVVQSTGVEINNLSNKMVQYGAPLRQMGFEFEEAAVLMGKFEKEGVNTELVLGSLRIALTRMAQEGVTDASAALEQIIEDIENAGSAGEANAIALEAFGSRAGPDMAAAIREGRFEIDELINTLNESGETINKAAEETMSFKEQMVLLKNKVTQALEPLGATLLQTFDRMFPTIEKAINFVGKLIEGFSNLPEPVQNLAVIFGGIFALGGPMLSGIGRFTTAVSGLIPMFSGVATKLGGIIGTAGPWGLAIAGIVAGVALIIKYWEPISEFFENLWNGIADVAKTVWNGIKDFLGSLWDGIKNVASKAWDGIKFVLTASWGDVIEGGKKIWNGLSDFFSGLWDGIKNTAAKAWDGIKDMLGKAWEGIKSLAENIWGGIAGFFGGIWDTITGKGKTAEIEVIKKEIGFDDYEDAADSLEYHTVPELELPSFDTQSLNNFNDLAASIGGQKSIILNADIHDNKISDDYDIDRIGDQLVRRLQIVGVAK